MDNKNKISILKTLLPLILIIQAVGMAFFFRSSNQLHSASFKRIDGLITEIGELKEENIILKQELNSQKDNYIKFLNNFENISREFNTSSFEKFQAYQEKFAHEKQKLIESNQALSNQLNQKQEEVLTLAKEKITDEKLLDLNQKTFTILFLGENQNLTDSIILAVINPEKAKTTLISIPRDLYVDGRKINEYFSKYGFEDTSKIIKKISGLAPDKYIQFNFKAFSDLIDTLGGIDIYVDQEINDNYYPTSDSKYKTVVFKTGLEKMNGERALEYARSRKSTSDFDRSFRQQKIIIALQEKLRSMNIMDNLNFYVTAFQSLEENLKTDISILEALQQFDLYKNYDLFAGNVLSNENFLYSAKSASGQSILLPKDKTFNQFKEKILEII